MMQHQAARGVVGHTLRWHCYSGVTYDDYNKIHLHWLTKVAIFCFFYTYVVQIVGLVQAKDDAEKFIEEFSVVSFCTVGILKLNAFLKTQYPSWYALLQLVKGMENEELTNESSLLTEYESDVDIVDTTSKFHKHITNYIKRFQDFLGPITKIYITTGVIYITTPFLEFGLLKLRAMHAEWPHVLPGCCIFDKMHVAGYIVNIVTEIIAAPFCVLLHLVFDITTVAICIFIGGQFDLIKDYSENICGKGREYYISVDRDKRAHDRVMRCHRMHTQLIIAMDGLKAMLQNLLGVYFFIVTLTVCTIAVRVNAVVSTVQLLSSIQYMCGTLIQLFLFCYYGNYVFNNSSIKMGEGPYGCAYWCVSPRIRKELCLLGVGMSKPHFLLAGPFVFVNLSSFIQIIRGAYSYYALIRKDD